MKVYVYPADQTGCGYYRAIWPSKALLAQGHDVTVINPDDAHNDMRVEVQNGEIKSISYPEDADVIVLQRPLHVWIAKAIPLLRSLGVAVVVDIDDDLESIHPKHPAFAVLNPKWNPVYNWNVTREACRAATLVTVSTAPLRKMYSPLSGNCVVIKNTVPEEFFSIEREDGNINIGWMGSVHSHPDDLQVMGQTPARLQREGFPWRFVGPDRGIQEALHFDIPSTPGSPRTAVRATGYVAMEDIPAVMARTIGIGVAPLQDTRFNRAKSYLKQLEYSALGIPSVCSDLPEYRELAQRTGALLARRPKDWYQHLKRLSLDDRLRMQLSRKARAGVADLTIQGNAHRWLHAWLQAYRLEQTKVTIGG